jgi:uncharacterized protein YjbJ (UPF0337 family)
LCDGIDDLRRMILINDALIRRFPPVVIVRLAGNIVVTRPLVDVATEVHMTRLQEKAQGATKQAVGQTIGDDKLVLEGKDQVRKAEGEPKSEKTSGHSDHGIVRNEKGEEQPKGQAVCADRAQDRRERFRLKRTDAQTGVETGLGGFTRSLSASAMPRSVRADRRRSVRRA